MIHGPPQALWPRLLAAWLAAAAVLGAQDLAWQGGRAEPRAAVPADPPPAMGAGAIRPISTGGSGIGGLVVEVELMETGSLPVRQAVEVRWQEVPGLSAWWWLTAAPLLMAFLTRGRGWRSLRARVRLG